MTANAELSAVATLLDDVAARITQIDAGLSAGERDALGADLAEVERSLDVTRRRLARLVAGRR
jgi:hypothetical protein